MLLLGLLDLVGGLSFRQQALLLIVRYVLAYGKRIGFWIRRFYLQQALSFMLVGRVAITRAAAYD